jgi:hypothetical protein
VQLGNEGFSPAGDAPALQFEDEDEDEEEKGEEKR